MIGIKNNKRIRRIGFEIILGVFFFCTMTASISYAAFDRQLQRGIEQYQQRKYDEAVVIFCRVLLEDSQQKDALRYLHDTLDAGKIVGIQKVALVRIIELFDYINFLKNQINDRKGKPAKASDLCSASDPMPPFSAKGEGFGQRLIFFMKNAKQQKECLAGYLHQLQGEDKKEVPSISAVKKDVESTGQVLSKISPAGHKRRIEDVRDEIAVFQQTIQDSQAKISSLNKEIAKKSLEVFEKENMLAVQASDFSNLAQELTDAKQRLSLVQRIISEKNNRIQSLETYIETMKTESLEENSISQKEVGLLRTQLEGIQERVDEQKRLQEERIAALEKLIAEQEIKIINYDAAVMRQRNTIDELKGGLAQQLGEVTALKNVVESKDTKLIELNGIIEIYKAKLTQTNNLIRQKNEYLENLQAELHETQEQLKNSQQMAQALYERIMQVESQISRIRVKEE